jgi:hypothetical protein
MIRTNYLGKQLLFLLILAGWGSSEAQIFVEKGVRPIYSTRVMRITKFKDMENFGDVFNSRKALLGKGIFSGNIAYTFGRIVLRQEEPQLIEWRSALSFYTRVSIVEDFSLNTNFFLDFNKAAVAPWTSDFTYSLGRFSWRSKSFSYGYKNYENNKYSDSFSKLRRKFLLGTLFVSYMWDLPERLISKIRLDYTSNIKLDFSTNYAFRYRDMHNNMLGEGLLGGKTWLSLAARYTIISNIYIESAVNFYPDPLKKQPWDPDYVYGFGYFDYRAFRLCFTYGNWVINRFPWNKQQYSEYGFLDGEFRVFVNYSW